MNPQNLSFGQGSPMLGNGGQVANQIEAGAPALNQMGSSAPGFAPNQQMQTQGLPQGAPAAPGIMPRPAQPAQSAPPKTEGHLIIEALMNRLKAISELEHRLHDLTEHIAGVPAKENG